MLQKDHWRKEQIIRIRSLFVGKKIIHKFNEGELSRRVISVVKEFPDFYNVVYDCDFIIISLIQWLFTQSYKLEDDYEEGNLRIVPGVRKYLKKFFAAAITQVETSEFHNFSTHNLFQRGTKYMYTNLICLEHRNKVHLYHNYTITLFLHFIFFNV